MRHFNNIDKRIDLNQRADEAIRAYQRRGWSLSGRIILPDGQCALITYGLADCRRLVCEPGAFIYLG